MTDLDGLARTDRLLDEIGARAPGAARDGDAVTAALATWARRVDPGAPAGSRSRGGRRLGRGLAGGALALVTLMGSSVAAAITDADFGPLTDVGRVVVAWIPDGAEPAHDPDADRAPAPAIDPDVEPVGPETPADAEGDGGATREQAPAERAETGPARSDGSDGSTAEVAPTSGHAPPGVASTPGHPPPELARPDETRETPAAEETREVPAAEESSAGPATAPRDGAGRGSGEDRSGTEPAGQRSAERPGAGPPPAVTPPPVAILPPSASDRARERAAAPAPPATGPPAPGPPATAVPAPGPPATAVPAPGRPATRPPAPDAHPDGGSRLRRGPGEG